MNAHTYLMYEHTNILYVMNAHTYCTCKCTETDPWQFPVSWNPNPNPEVECHTTFLLSATVQAIEKRIRHFVEPTLNNVRSDFQEQRVKYEPVT